MKAGSAKKTVRCAIYTRVSTDQGLDQDFMLRPPSYRGDQRILGRSIGCR